MGYSYCGGDPTAPGTSCGDWNDTSTAAAQYAALAAWRVLFPEVGARDLYIVGESYGGQRVLLMLLTPFPVAA